MLNLDYTLFQQVAEQAASDAAAHPRWLTAIGRAIVEIDSNPYLEWQDGHLLIASPSGAIYSANGICQCAAYDHGQPCWHRAAARLVRRYHEDQAKQVSDKIATARRVAYEKATREMNELFA